MARAITVDFLGNDKTLSRTLGDVDSRTGRLGKTMRRVALITAGLLAGAVVLGGKALWDMGKAASADQKAQELLARTLKNAAGATDSQIAAVEDWISAQGRALGVADDDLRPALQRLTEATGDVGKAQKLTSLAMDVSAGTGKSLKTVSEALAKAQMGQVGALSRYGIRTRDAAGEMMTFDEVVKSASKTFKGQASTAANTLDGKMGRLKLIFDETKEAIGARLLPIALRFSTWMLNEGLPAVEAFGTWLGDKLGPIFTKVGDIWGKVTGAMSGDTSGTVGQIRSFLIDLGSIFSSTVSIIQSLWAKFGTTLTALTRGNFAAIFQIIRGAFQIIAGIFKVVASVLKGDWRGAWDGIKQILRGAWKVITGLIRLGMNTAKALMRAAWIAIKSLTKAAWDGIKQLPRLALKAIQGFIKTALTGYRVLFRAGWDAMRNVARSAWDGIRNIVGNGVDRIMSAIRAIPGKIRNLGGAFFSAGKAILGRLIDGLTSVAGFVGDIARGVKSAVVGAMNDVIRSMNNAIPNSIPLKGLPDIPLPDNPIPPIGLATGGIVRARRGGTLALLGEGGHDEAVIPLSGPHAPKLAGTTGGDIVVPITLTLDGRTIHQALLRLKRTTGEVLGLS